MSGLELMEEHTPGPWSIEDNRSLNDAFWIGTHDEYGGFLSLAEVRAGCDEAGELGDEEANARLIAAAPDLLKAAQDVHLRGDKASFRALEAAISRAIQPQDEGEGR